MKYNFLLIFTFSLSFFLFNNETQAQTKKLIHYWHFNNTVTGQKLGSIPPNYSTLKNASIIYKPVKVSGASDTTQSYIDNLAGDTINQRSGYGGCCGATNYGVRTRNPSDYMQFLWYIPTNKYQNIIIRYETQSSSTASGQHRQVYSYSVDSALTFTTAGLPIAYDSAGTAWGKVKLDLSSIPAVNNNGKLVLRMKFTSPNTGTSGNNRFDNITVEGDTIIKPEFTSTALATGIINIHYSYAITTSASPVVFSVTGNPSWLTLNGNMLEGTPISTGTFGPITITAANLAGSSTQIFDLVVGDNVNTITPAITSVAPITAITGSVFIYKISATGFPKPSISVSGNPAWLTLSDTTLSGIPPSFGLFGPVTITATNVIGSAQQTFNITVPGSPLITSKPETNGITTVPYVYTIIASGLPVPVISVSGNPSWLTLNDNVLAGTPPIVGTVGPVLITVSNSEGSSQQTFNIIVSSAPKITTFAPSTGIIGSVYTYDISVDGTPDPAISVTGNPSWLTLNGNSLSGIPASAGVIGPVTITVTNSVSTVKQKFYIKVGIPSVNTAASKLIHYWHFNNTLPADGSGNAVFGTHPIPADFSKLINASIVYKPIRGVARDTGSIDNLVGDTINQRPAFGGCCGDINNAVRTRNPSDSMQFLWYLPTKNYKNIVIKYETEASSTKSGQKEQIFSYSLDSAVNFVNTGFPFLSEFADTTWGMVTLDLRSLTSVNNNNKFVLRINFSAPNTGSKGNNRFDNITVEGEPINDSINDISKSDYILYPNPVLNILNLKTTYAGEKMISIYNSAGILMSSYFINGTQSAINTSFLSQGMYFIKITETSSKKSKSLKFIKEQ